MEKHSLWELVLNHMYHAALNLNQKIAHIVEQEQEVGDFYSLLWTFRGPIFPTCSVYFKLLIRSS